MKLFTIQPLEVIEILTKYNIYKPEFDKCFYLQDEDDKLAFDRPYRWILEQYNRIKENEISTPLVWWYTDLEEATQSFKRRDDTSLLLIRADVDDKDVLLHDADLWETGPFMNCPLGSISCEENYEAFFKDETHWDAMWKAYKHNIPAMEETWKEIFVVQQSKQERQRLHALTPYIYKSYIKPEPKEEISQFDEI